MADESQAELVQGGVTGPELAEVYQPSYMSVMESNSGAITY